MPRALPPFDSWPVQVFDPAFGFAWFAEPAVVVTQLSVDWGTRRVATRLHDLIDLALKHERASIDHNGGLFILHDFRLMTGYDIEGRVEFLERMRRRGPGYSRGAAVAVRVDRPLVRMAIQGANLVSAIAVKAPLKMVEDPTGIVAAEVKAPPMRGKPFPGLD